MSAYGKDAYDPSTDMIDCAANLERNIGEIQPVLKEAIENLSAKPALGANAAHARILLALEQGQAHGCGRRQRRKRASIWLYAFTVRLARPVRISQSQQSRRDYTT